MPHTFQPCPHCNAAGGLEWSTVNWSDGDGDEPRMGVVCDACGAEIELTYGLVEVELRCLPDGTVV